MQVDNQNEEINPENEQGQTIDNNVNNVVDNNEDTFYQDLFKPEEGFDYKELDEEVAFQHLKATRNLDVESIDDLLKPKEVNPFEDVLDDEDKLYLKYKKEQGGSRKDFENFTKNLDEVPKIEFARERVRKETGLSLSDEEADEYLSNKLGIIDFDDLSVSDNIELTSYAKPILDSKKEEQNKFINSIKQEEPKKEEPKIVIDDFVKLDNGSIMRKDDYESLIKNRQTAIDEAKKAVNSVTSSNFKIEIDDKGTKKELSYSYDFSEEDKQRMLSNASDYDSVLNSRYSSEKGFDHKNFAIDFQWADPEFRNKAIASILHKAIAENTEAIFKERGNVNFSQNRLQQNQSSDVKIVSIADAIKGNV